MKPTLKTLLVDDEIRSLETLQWLLENCCPEVTVVGTCSDPLQVPAGIARWKPDLVLMDIAMPGLNGFDLLHRLFPIAFSVVFVTAHNGAILSSLRRSGLPYLLKPVDDEELTSLIQQISRRRPRVTAEQLQVLRTHLGIER